jgi:hypothetical protein
MTTAKTLQLPLFIAFAAIGIAVVLAFSTGTSVKTGQALDAALSGTVNAGDGTGGLVR